MKSNFGLATSGSRALAQNSSRTCGSIAATCLGVNTRVSTAGAVMERRVLEEETCPAGSPRRT